MGGACSSSFNNLDSQEKYVRRNFNKYNSQLSGKYSRDQIECKIRQMYHNTDLIKSGTFISQSAWRNAKTRKK